MSRYSKTVADGYDDIAEVSAGGMLNPNVYLSVTEAEYRPAQLSLTPKQARRLAKALRKAAKIAKENA